MAGHWLGRLGIATTGLGTATELTQRRLRSDVPQLLAQDLLDARDRLVDRLLGADALGGDAVDRLGPDALVLDPVVP